MDIEWETVWAVIIAVVILNGIALALAFVGVTASSLPGSTNTGQNTA